MRSFSLQITKAMVLASAVLLVSLPCAAQSVMQTCGSPACAAIDNKYANRLHTAWGAQATTEAQRQKMSDIIRDHTSNGVTNWEGAATAYFSWRQGIPYVFKEDPIKPAEDEKKVWENWRATIESAITDRLIDPHSAEYKWSSLFVHASWKPDLFEKRVSGWVTCGYVNSKNRMGGYSGKMAFSAVIENNVIKHLSIDSPGKELNSYLCEKAGLLPGQ